MAEAIIKCAEVGSIAEELGVEAGDVLLSVNGNPIGDIFDYRFFTAEEELLLSFRTKDGEEVEIELEKDADEELGIIFESGLIDGPKRCSNACVFCFIDQLPKGMRETLYFKDDDTRLSFLHGNYVTLTNLSDRDIERICEMRISVLNVSVHTTNPKLRVKMLRNKHADNLMPRLRRLVESGINVNTQIVLCPELNDGEELSRTIGDLLALAPGIGSLSVVPVGVSDHREGLYPLRTFTREESGEVVRQVTLWQEKALREKGTRFVYLSDEFYLNAGMPIPDAAAYEGFPQIENGVGLIASLKEEWECAREEAPAKIKTRNVSIATGKAAAPLMRALAEDAMELYPNLTVRVYEIENRFLGKNITVAGLLCGVDLKEQLAGEELGEELLISSSMLRFETEDFLDDCTVTELSQYLGVPVRAVDNDGWSLFSAITRAEPVCLKGEQDE